jgi:hypothetical protein
VFSVSALRRFNAAHEFGTVYFILTRISIFLAHHCNERRQACLLEFDGGNVTDRLDIMGSEDRKIHDFFGRLVNLLFTP